MVPTPENQENLYDLLSGFETAMMVTHATPTTMACRPMAVVELRHDADLLFVTGLDSPKMTEIEANPNVLMTFQSSSKYASVSGKAEVVTDKELIAKHWQEAWRVWFPKGLDDPALCLIRFDADAGEYWDGAGLKGLKLSYNAVRAYVKGETVKADETMHAKVPL